MVEDLKQKRWTFTYIGTNHDVDKVALSLSITNVIKFAKTEAGMKDLFAKEASARRAYSKKIRLKEDTAANFYEEPKE